MASIAPYFAGPQLSLGTRFLEDQGPVPWLAARCRAGATFRRGARDISRRLDALLEITYTKSFMGCQEGSTR